MLLCFAVLSYLLAFYFFQDIRNISFSELNLRQVGEFLIGLMGFTAGAYFLIRSLVAGERVWPWRWSQHPIWPYVFWYSTSIAMIFIIQIYLDGSLRIALIGLLVLFICMTLNDLYKTYRAGRN